MADEEDKVVGARLSPEKAKTFDELGISAKELLEEAIDTKAKKNNITNKKQLVNKLMVNGVYAIIGLCFLSALNFQSNIFSLALIGGIGGFFTVIGSIQLYLTIREVKGYKKNVGK